MFPQDCYYIVVATFFSSYSSVCITAITKWPLLFCLAKKQSFSSDFDEQKLQDYAWSIDRSSSNPLSRLLLFFKRKKRPTSLLKDGKKSCKRKKSLDERSVFQRPQFPGGELSLSINGNEKSFCISGRRAPELARGVIETQDRKWEFYTLVLHYLLREEKCQK